MAIWTRAINVEAELVSPVVLVNVLLRFDAVSEASTEVEPRQQAEFQ